MKEHLGEYYDKTSYFPQEQFDTLKSIIATAIPDTNNAKTLLDIGCGSGSRTVQCLDIFKNLEKMVGIDPDWQMIEAAKKLHGHSKAEYKILGAEDIPQLYDQRLMFDAVVSNWSLHWVKEKKKMMEDLAPVTHTGSYLAFSACQAVPSILMLVDEYLRSAFHAPAEKSPYFHQSASVWRDAIESSGWKILALEERTVNRDVKSAQEYLDGWFAASATKGMYGKHIAELSDLTIKDILQMMQHAYPSSVPGMELNFDEEALFVVAQRG